MGERTTYGRSHDKGISRDPDFESFDDETVVPRSQSYRFGRTVTGAGNDYPSEESMPMFLSDYDEEEQHMHERHMHVHGRDEHVYEEDWHPTRTRRPSVSSRILMAVVAAAAVAVLFALVTSDATRDMIATAKASIIGATPDPTAPAQPAVTQLTARDLQLNEPARLPPAPMLETQKPVQTASTAPSREDIANAYQSALQTRAPLDVPASPSAEPAAAAPAPVASSPASITAPGAASAIVTPPFGAVAVGAPPPQQHAVRRMDPDELAGLMRRAKTLLAAGDIPPARLLLERAADAQEPAAALMLAQTYDAQVLGTRDVRNINADPNAARNWYRRAAQLGSTEAQRRLNQLQN